MNASAPALRYSGHVPAMTATLTALIAVCVLAGWMLGIGPLKTVLPGTVEMKANTALGLLAAALSLAILSGRVRPRWSAFAQGLGLAVALLGLATLAEYVFEFDLGIDELFFRDPHPGTTPPGRMSPYS